MVSGRLQVGVLAEVADDQGQNFGGKSPLLDELVVELVERVLQDVGYWGLRHLRKTRCCKSIHKDFGVSFVDDVVKVVVVCTDGEFHVLIENLHKVQQLVRHNLVTGLALLLVSEVLNGPFEKTWHEPAHAVVVDLFKGLDENIEGRHVEMFSVEKDD